MLSEANVTATVVDWFVGSGICVRKPVVPPGDNWEFSAVKVQRSSWAPFVFSGHPQIADPQSVIFSPLYVVLALFNSAPISAEMVERYAAEKAVALDPPTAEESASYQSGKSCAIQFVSLPLISESWSVRHAPEKLSKAIFNIYSRCGFPSP